MKKQIVSLVCAAVFAMAGCAIAHHPTVPAGTMKKMEQAKQAALVCYVYARDHGGQYPPTLQATAGPGYPSPQYLDEVIAKFELVYTGATTNIANPAGTIILKEKQPWQGKKNGHWVKVYAFADCHCELHQAGDGNFDEWEKERIVKP